MSRILLASWQSAQPLIDIYIYFQTKKNLKHTQTCARCSLFSSSCLACLRAALCTLRVSLASSSSSVPAFWKSVEEKLILEGSGNSTHTPTTSVEHDDFGVTTLSGLCDDLLRFYWATESRGRLNACTNSSYNVGRLCKRECWLYLNGVRSLECQCVGHINRLGRENSGNLISYIRNKQTCSVLPTGQLTAVEASWQLSTKHWEGKCLHS